MICLTLMEDTIEKNFAVFMENSSFVDIIELRLDMLVDPLLVDPELVRSKFNFPVIITCRLVRDGGKYSGNEYQRRDILYQFSNAGFDYIDLEMGIVYPEVEEAAHSHNTRIIRSYHNFEGIPDNFEEIFRELASGVGEIPKAAVFLEGSSQVYKFFKIIEKIHDIDEKIVLGMGDFGIPTRVLYKKLGSFLSYCSVLGRSGAPGQLTPDTMKNMYRSDCINNSTFIYGIAGNPVMHSGSPNFHNTGYKRSSLNAVYIPFLVDDINYFFKLAEVLPLCGFSVTVPFKVDVLGFLDRKSPEVVRTDSCNTVFRNSGMWEGYNTDLEGFLSPLAAIENLTDRLHRAAVIGAGGAARSVVAALKSLGLEISIFNRSEERGRILADETACSFFPLEMFDLLSGYDLIVQTTSVGMIPDVEKTPVPGYRFHKDQLAYDIIYTPLKTKFLREAESSGAEIIGGMDMLISQGALQFEIFTDREYPLEEQKESS